MKPDNNFAVCLCGKVEMKIKWKNSKYTVCRCNSCQKWSGGPLLMASCGTEIVFEGREFIKEYRSSPWATRAFCTECGTHLFSRFIANDSYNIPVGLLPDGMAMEMDVQYFIDQKPKHYSFANQTKTMTKAQVLEFFS
ncbi:GFA family protein [Vibrio europaeus]|uniref:GFA family protein n=1 Tax=Vibrio europaeus TaxID=300876 RepID=UPI00233E5D0A|nr:GFA family protein [Vibrio europaeus]MDC5820095.1 GFA family protein [Vibrio europaeus]